MWGTLPPNREMAVKCKCGSHSRSVKRKWRRGEEMGGKHPREEREIEGGGGGGGREKRFEFSGDERGRKGRRRGGGGGEGRKMQQLLLTRKSRGNEK